MYSLKNKTQDKLVLLLAGFSLACALLSIFAVTTKSKFIITIIAINYIFNNIHITI